MYILGMYMNDSALKRYLADAAAEAEKSPCLRRRCGSVVVSCGEVIGRGYNSPAGGEDARCSFEKSRYHRKVTDTRTIRTTRDYYHYR